MLSFFKRKHTDEELQRTGGESNVAASNIDENIAEPTNEMVEPELSLHPSWNVTKEEAYVYRFLHFDCPPMKRNQLAISGIEVVEERGGLHVSAFIRNSSKKTITFGEKTLVLLGRNGEQVARSRFDLAEIGELPPESSRPWHFLFEGEDLYQKNGAPENGWRLTFEERNIPKEHQLDVTEEWAAFLGEEMVDQLQQFVKQLRPLQKNEINLFGFQADEDKYGAIQAVALMRNGSEENIKVDKLTLQLEDANGDVISVGQFDLGDFTVKPNTSKLCRFIFHELRQKEYDLSSWTLKMPKPEAN
ncbi:hypothetical protein JCM9140_2331 [Halalkalibacter wakoensis JCM 9140]|uniref:Accessory Sec system S-layer assembly protein n=1 Tax=Halalkalibacter wakoensis JCM 9140 TaxID=1236970 RepID=W4Q2R9_9BACI|nr:accessory Sec system S-layer assembly protein [Halalkalibacter wakoensis]GAE26282.1 hypothetical protein JCM9140_2331 [Halalkalibacter wakoensis JCM 9140]